MTPLLEGKVAVVTGGARGIGEAIARLFVEHGARVVLGDRDGEAARATARAIDADAVRGIACDVTDGQQVQALLAHATDSIVGLTKAAAKEVARHRIRVNAIQPGLVATEMTQAMPEHIWDAKLAETPMERAGAPEEIASVALFLASDLSSYMTGTVLEVTGGRLM